MRLGEGWRVNGWTRGAEEGGRGSVWRDGATELGERLAVVARICPWGWHRPLGAERLVAGVERAYGLPPYEALWQLEALGYRWVATSAELAAGEAPPPLPAGALPPASLTMLHVGFGMALARHRLAGVRGDASVAGAVRRFLADARRSTPAACLDAVVEPLGVVARFEHRRRVGAVARALAAASPEHEPWYWHGVGRCLLFLPRTFLPLPEAGWRAARRLAREVPAGPPRHRARVGWACGLTLVHMRRPEVLAGLVRRRGGTIEAARDGFAADFAEGVARAVDIRLETTPGCGDLVEAFLAHRPAGGRAAALRWRRLVEEPGLAALAAAGDGAGACAGEPAARPAPRRAAVPSRRPRPGLEVAPAGGGAFAASAVGWRL